MDISVFTKLFMEVMKTTTSPFMARITQRCRPYVKGVRTQDTPTAKNFEQHVNFVAYDVLRQMGVHGFPAVCEHMSDTAIETDTCIIQLDAKACEYTDGDFRSYKNGFKIHCGEAQTSLTGKYEDTPIKGLQSQIIDGKPVYTLLSFMRWGYSDKYFAESVGIVLIPHDQDKVKVGGGKSKKECRFYIKDPTMYHIHSFASQSAQQIQDLVQSELKSDEESLQQDQLSQNQQMDP